MTRLTRFFLQALALLMQCLTLIVLVTVAVYLLGAAMPLLCLLALLWFCVRMRSYVEPGWRLRI